MILQVDPNYIFSVALISCVGFWMPKKIYRMDPLKAGPSDLIPNDFLRGEGLGSVTPWCLYIHIRIYIYVCMCICNGPFFSIPDILDLIFSPTKGNQILG